MEDIFTKCIMNDLSFQGSSIFTWKGNGVKERLDRVVATSSWKKDFPDSEVLHLTDKVTSDHILILLQTHGQKKREKIWKATAVPFRKVVRAYNEKLEGRDITTVVRLKTSEQDLYYDALKLVSTHLIQLDYIAVLENDIVTYERMVTFTTITDIDALFLNSTFSRKPTREYKLANLPEFPSPGRCEKIPLNLSEYLAQTWLLTESIDGKEPRQQVVDRISGKQVRYLKKWFDDLSARNGGRIGISENLMKKASKSACAIIVLFVYDNIISLLEKRKIKEEGTVIDLYPRLRDATNDYFGVDAKRDLSEIVVEPKKKK